MGLSKISFIDIVKSSASMIMGERVWWCVHVFWVYTYLGNQFNPGNKSSEPSFNFQGLRDTFSGKFVAT